MRAGGTAEAVPFPKNNDSLRSLVFLRLNDLGKLANCASSGDQLAFEAVVFMRQKSWLLRVWLIPGLILLAASAAQRSPQTFRRYSDTGRLPWIPTTTLALLLRSNEPGK